jgi:hypothetical protein
MTEFQAVTKVRIFFFFLFFFFFFFFSSLREFLSFHALWDGRHGSALGFSGGWCVV